MASAQYISQPVKFLGKLYVDRMPGERPNQALLFKAVAIIQRQAPSKNKSQVAFFTTNEMQDPQTGQIRPAALCGRKRDGSLAIEQPMITIVSVGHTNKAFVYVTVEPKEGDTNGMLRFWIYAFSCKSKDMGVKLATHCIKCCSDVRGRYRERKARGITARMSKNPNTQLPEDAAPAFGDETFIDGAQTADGQVDLSLALDAANSMIANQSMQEGDFKTTSLDEDDFNLATEAMDEMYDLDCALERYRLPVAFRNQLMDAWQKGYNQGGSITQKCGSDPSKVEVNTAMVRV